MEKSLRSWGVRFNQDFSHSLDFSCPYCEWRSDGMSIRNMVYYLVGFDTTCRRGNGFPGVFIFECPQCFEKFWYHACRESIDLLVLVDAWPK